MKLVREHINEKFTEDSDPIHDMGIGSKIIYYHFHNHDIYKPIYYLKLIGYKINNEELQKLISDNDQTIFTWNNYLEGWESINAASKKYWLNAAPKIFKHIERMPKYVIIPSKNTEFKIPGYEYEIST